VAIAPWHTGSSAETGLGVVCFAAGLRWLLRHRTRG